MRGTDQRGMALLSVLVVILVLALLGGLVLYLAGQESQLSTVRYRAAQSLNIAEGGAWAARAALMALMNADPTDATVVDPSLDGTTMQSWWAGGNPGNQQPFKFLDYLITDNERLSVNAVAADDWVALRVNWSRPSARLKLEFLGKGSGTPPADPLALGSVPSNPLGEGGYRAVVVLVKRAVPDDSCAGGLPCFIHRTGPDQYQVHLEYRVVSDGQVDPQFRRRVTLRGNFNVVLGNTSFAQWALFTHVHLTPDDRDIWFTSRTSFDGPVHTNGEFRFAFFPKFGTPDAQTPCDPARIAATRLTSTSQYAWFNNGGSPRRLQANENVVGTTRVDAPVLPDCTPGNVSDDSDNPAAQFTRGFDADPSTPQIDPITVPPNSYNQKGISIGRDPADVSTVTNRQIRQAVPELPDNNSSVPSGVYVPVADANGNGRSDDGEALAGGIFVQGDLARLTLSACGPDRDGDGDPDLACYTFVHSTGQTVTVTVDRQNNRTTVTNSDWDPNTPGNQSGTRTFVGVPKGYQGPGYPNATLIYVEGNVGSSGDGLSGTVEEKEQVTIAASGRIDIVGHVRYERPPNVTDPLDNPLNVLGLYSASRDIRIRRTAPADLVLHAVLMAGQPGVNDGYRSVVFVENYDSIPCRGAVHLIGGLIEEYYGAFGTFDPTTGNCRSGYGREFRWDRRMGRGFSPPYFPTTTIPALQAQELAGVKPQWREGSPP